MTQLMYVATAMWLVLSPTTAHWPSDINLESLETIMKEGTNESINAQWQCDPLPPEELGTGVNNYHLRGVNLGSWMVLEPWITPSMFFQFLGREVDATGSGKQRVGMDMFSFCEALGPKEGNKQLRRHWATWVTEVDIAQLATYGVNTIRLPVGDWMYKPYGPYIGCTDGALDEIGRLFDMCRRYGLRVLLDIHALKGSQNGLDNSGQTMDLEWTTYSGNKVAGTATFAHWPYRAARWIGDFNRATGEYDSKNEDNIEHSLQVIQTMVDMYAEESVVMGLQPVNEPWQFTPVEWLKQFYWDGYHIVREQAPHWLFLMHDSFNFDIGTWGDFMKNCPTIGLDTHVYQAWVTLGPQAAYLASACDIQKAIVAMENAGMPVVVGEWSLATDNCAMWLNGFNDNLPGYPQVQCQMVTCPLPYMGNDQPGAPPNPNYPPIGPFGTGSSSPRFGMCPVDGAWHREDDFMTDLAYAKLWAFEAGHGWFFWNFKTELEARWDYIEATTRGYFPFHVSSIETDDKVKQACDRFTGRKPVKGMPPGIYAEVGNTRESMTVFGGIFFLLGVAATAIVVAIFKARRTRGLFRGSRGWFAVGDGAAIRDESVSSQAERTSMSLSSTGYQ